MMTDSKYKKGILVLFSICLVWASLLDHGQHAVSFSSISHRTTAAAVELIVADQCPRDQVNATPAPSDSLPDGGAINQSVLFASLHQILASVLTKEQIAGLQPTSLPVVCLISILRKKNGLHQSSQDDPHLNSLSFI